MRTQTIFGALFWLLLLQTTLLAHGKGWEPLFNGKDLSGWRVVGPESWRVDDGSIVGETETGAYGWLVSDRKYSNFVLHLRFKWEGGNSGVQFRSHVEGEHVHGYQADIWPDEPRGTGMLYEEGGRGTLARARSEAGDAFLKNGWNDYEISAIGNHLQIYLNGAQTVDVHDSAAKSGIIALQVHSGEDVRVRWKDIRILEVSPTAEWKNLLEGSSLRAWREVGPGSWHVRQGVLRSETQGEDWGWLVTRDRFADFVLRLRFRWVRGNSGVQFRSGLENGLMSGYQADIFPERPRVTGALYEMNGRGGLDEADTEATELLNHSEWNDYEISAIGDRIQLFLNGVKSVDLTDSRQNSGLIGLQLHKGQQVELLWKDIRILELE